MLPQTLVLFFYLWATAQSKTNNQISAHSSFNFRIEFCTETQENISKDETWS